MVLILIFHFKVCELLVFLLSHTHITKKIPQIHTKTHPTQDSKLNNPSYKHTVKHTQIHTCTFYNNEYDGSGSNNLLLPSVHLSFVDCKNVSLGRIIELNKITIVISFTNI